MQITNLELLETKAALEALGAQSVKNVERPDREIAKKIRRNALAIVRALREYEWDRQELVSAFAERDKRDKKIIVDGTVKIGDTRGFSDKIAEIQADAVEVAVELFSEDQFIAIGKRYVITSNQLAALDWLVVSE